MDAPTKLSDAELQRTLPDLPGWSLVGGKLRWEHRFADFSQAFGFMTRVALAAEALGHHPDWSNAWSRVTIELVTHDAGGITARDVDLARRIVALANG